jgi:hypothetical protein
VALKNVERPMELMRVRIDSPEEPEAEAPRATADDEVPAEVAVDDATMRA